MLDRDSASDRFQEALVAAWPADGRLAAGAACAAGPAGLVLSAHRAPDPARTRRRWPARCSTSSRAAASRRPPAPLMVSRRCISSCSSPSCTRLYRVLPHRAQNVMLLGASYYFYGSWDWRFLSLLMGSTLVDFLVGRGTSAARPIPAGASSRSSSASCSTWACSAFFKYFEFFADSLVALGATIGWRFDPLTLARHAADRHLVLHVHDDQLRHRRVSPRDPADDAPRSTSRCSWRISRTWSRGRSCARRCSCRRSSGRARSRASTSRAACGSSAGAASRRCSSPTTSRRWSTRCSARRPRRPAPDVWWPPGRSRFRFTATSPATRTSRAACHG